MGKKAGKKAERKEKAEKVRMQRRRCEKVQRRRRGKRGETEKEGETGNCGRDRTAEEESGRKWRDKKSVGLDDRVRNRFIIMDIVVQVAA